MPTAASEFVIFVEEPPDISVKDGIVHIEDRSGNLVFKRVMPISAFMQSLARANSLIAQWEAEVSGRFVRVFPSEKERAIRKRRGGQDDHAA